MTPFINPSGARGAQTARPQGSPLQQAMLEDAACARPSNVMPLVDALIPSDWLKRATS